MKEILPDPKTAAQAEMLANRIRKRHRHLRKWARRIGTDAFRLYDRDIPEIPLLLDLYGDALSGSLYERPYEKDALEEEEWLRAMSSALALALDIPERQIFIKQRRRQRGKDQYEREGDAAFIREIQEGGLRFRVNLSDYLDTGLFLDHRRTRAMVRDDAAGKRVLNLFCYTASFSVYAASGGARRVDSVDSSNTYLDWAKTNLELNGFGAVRMDRREYFAGTDAGTGDRGPPSPNPLIRAEALAFLEEALRQGRTWDLIILDPPSFSNSKRMAGTLDIRRDYQTLISRCLSLLNPRGKLYFSTNARGFKLEAEVFPGIRIENITEKTRDEDFMGKKIPSCYIFNK